MLLIFVSDIFSNSLKPNR